MVVSSKYTAPKEDDTFVLTIPAKKDKSPDPAHDREIDLSKMDEQDLKSLQKSDPFMYYSIPGVLKASLNFENVDYSDITNQSDAESHPAEDDASKVSRRTRISFESHPSVILEDMLNDLDEEFGDLLHDLDDIVSMLGKRCCLTRQ